MTSNSCEKSFNKPKKEIVYVKWKLFLGNKMEMKFIFSWISRLFFGGGVNILFTYLPKK